jgi:hypothetical protein
VAIANYYDSGGSSKGRGALWKKKKEFGEVKMHVCGYGCVWKWKKVR